MSNLYLSLGLEDGPPMQDKSLVTGTVFIKHGGARLLEYMVFDMPYMS